MFDAAISSNNPAVKKALRNFMMIAAITEAQNTNENGPFSQLFDRISRLESEISLLNRKPSTFYDPYRTSAGTPYPYSSGGISSTVTSIASVAGTSGITKASNGSSISEADIYKLMKDLKSDPYWSSNDVSSIEQSYKDANGK
jgi:hypothetical protein